MQRKRQHQVFVSSNFLDLQTERLAAISTVREMNCIPAGFEQSAGFNRNAWTEIKATIDACDLFVILIGTSYGSVGLDGYSYTEMEYRYALEKGKPILALVRTFNDLDEDLRSTLSEENLVRFKGFVAGRPFHEWVSTEDLKQAISSSLRNFIEKNAIPIRRLTRPAKKSGTPKRSKRSQETAPEPTYVFLRNLVSSTSWTVGAVNLDEDLHFSSFYLRQSTRRYASKNLKAFSYSKLIAIYHDFNERYYLPKDECVQVAHNLITRMLADPDWFQHDILDEIHRRAQGLSDVFAGSKEDRPFASATNKELLSQYQKHNRAHVSLYQVARIPETLDRGVGYFTDYLRRDLIKRLPLETPTRTITEHFDALTFPEEQSKRSEEIEDLFKLAQEIKDRHGETYLSGSSQRMIMSLEPEILGKIKGHRDKWSFWGYHGYGTRVTYDLTHYLDQISQAATKGTVAGMNPSEYKTLLSKAEDRRKQLFDDLRIDLPHQTLYRFYSRIGNAKLVRRFVQLRNFYYLDQLLAEIASRTSLSEANIRSLMPDEIESLLRKDGDSITDSQRKRADYCVLVITDDNEKVLSGRELSWLELELQKSVRPESGGGLIGSPLCPGIATGRVRIVNRREDADKVGFREGDILASQSADPELAELMSLASGVLVETGGVTCHAGIICRELGKPAIADIHGLCSQVKNGDFVKVDAFAGTVTVSRQKQLHYIRHSDEIDESMITEFGGKAVSLAKMQSDGVNVPRFFAIPLSKLSSVADPQDAAGTEQDRLIQEIKDAAELLESSMFIVRSSMSDEDREDVTTAGQYLSESNIDKEDLVSALLRVLHKYRSTYPNLEGSLVVQDMILGDYSGVCFTSDPVQNIANRMVIEAIPGGNELLTSGDATPNTYYFDKGTRVLDEAKGKWGQLLPGQTVRMVADECEQIATSFGKAQDIEWTLKKDELWIVQSRNIQKTGASILRTKSALRDPEGLRDISTICRAFRVPPNLKLHLLRVAAVGRSIARHWIGPPIDEEVITKTLLLHDIGNIVKVDYRKNPDLFPEEMQNLKYWMAVQEMIRERHGQTDTTATLSIAEQIGASTTVLELIERKQFILNEATLASSEWERKIAAYADQRVGPWGIVSLDDRLAEARKRYHDVETASVNSLNFENLRTCAFAIERDLSTQVSIPLSAIDDELIAPIIEELRTEKLF